MSITPQMLEEDDLGPADEALLDLLTVGRVTAPYAAEETGYSLQYVRDRLGRLVEHGNARKVYEGLYELVEDPREDTGDEQTERQTDTTADMSTGDAVDESESPTEPSTDVVSDVDTIAAGADVMSAVEAVAESWQDSETRLEHRRAAAAKVLCHALESGEPVGKSSPIVEEAREEFPVEGQSDETFWRKNIRPVLKEYGDYNAGAHGYVVNDLG